MSPGVPNGRVALAAGGRNHRTDAEDDEDENGWCRRPEEQPRQQTRHPKALKPEVKVDIEGQVAIRSRNLSASRGSETSYTEGTGEASK